MNEYRKVFRAGCIEREKREEESNNSGKEGGMGVERDEVSKTKQCGKEKSTVKLVWMNVRKIRTREKQMGLEVWVKENECDVCAINRE